MQGRDTGGDGCPEIRTTVSTAAVQAGLYSPIIESDSGRRRLRPSLDAEYWLGPSLAFPDSSSTLMDRQNVGACSPNDLGDELRLESASRWHVQSCRLTTRRGDGRWTEPELLRSRAGCCVPSVRRNLADTRSLEQRRLKHTAGDAAAPYFLSVKPRRTRSSVRRAAPNGSAPLGGLMLWWRNGILRLLERLYWTVTLVGSLLLLAAGGFVPVLRGWLRNEVDGWSDAVATLGGVWFAVETKDPDSDLGPVLARVDAPQLFTTIDAVGRRLGVKPPGQVRLTYLPCCGVVAWGRSRALIIGLPLFRVLTQGELRAIVAHELAHLARGDATRAARSARFVEALEQAVERNGRRVRGPLGRLGTLLPA